VLYSYNELEEEVVPLPLVEEISVETKINDEFDDETIVVSKPLTTPP